MVMYFLWVLNYVLHFVENDISKVGLIKTPVANWMATKIV